VSISYSRPGVKGREIFGGLVPYGELWRTGANKSTTVKFSDDVNLEGQKVPAGEYALYTIPGKKEWTIIISKNIGSGTSKYKKEDDVTRFNVKSGTLNNSVERLTIEVTDMTNNSAQIMLKWATTKVSFGMMVDTDSKMMAQINQVMKDPDLEDANIYFGAGNYYFSNDKDIDQALKWVNRAVELKPDAFWMSRVKAQIQAKMGDYKAAIETAQLSLNAAEKAGSDQYVRFNRDAIAEWQTK
jgi:tetratricopeptide (TPR) repeat protein